LELLPGRFQDGLKKQAGVRACLNQHYWGISSESENSELVGSWGKATQVRPAMDIDVMFILPNHVYWRFEARSGNKQSQILQEVRSVLADHGRYLNTEIRGDRNVVVVKFESVWVEVVPAFKCQDGSLIICDASRDGRYKPADPLAELVDLDGSDARWGGNARALTRMIKKWLDEKDVRNLKPFHVERLAINFLDSWLHSNQSRFYYDWMIRDFFRYLLTCANESFRMPGTGELISLGSDWLPAALVAYRNASGACLFEKQNREIQAGESWQKIFGSAAPVRVS